MKQFNKIAVVGSAGNVGINTVHDLILNNVAKEYILIDVNAKVLNGHVNDLSDLIPLAPYPFTIKAGSYQDCGDADLVVVTAGRNQRPDETRLQLLKDNAKIMLSIINELNAVKFNGFLIICSNPVDIMTYLAHKNSSLPSERIIGSGTLLDSARLDLELSKSLEYNFLDKLIIGEHGDSSLMVWEDLNKPSKDNTDDLEAKVRGKAMVIIKDKGYTAFGIAAAVRTIVNALRTPEVKKYPLSVYVDEYDVCLSLPTYINEKGILKSDTSILITKNQAIKSKFKNSVGVIKKTLDSIK